MTTRATNIEIVAWSALALLGGLAAGWVDSAASDVQAPALIVMLVAFAITLPGRAPVALVGVLSAVGIPVLHWVRLHEANPGFVLVLVPSFIGAAGGRFAGGLLDVAVAETSHGAVETAGTFYDRPLTTRFLLAIAVVVTATIGYPAIVGALAAIGHRAPAWVGLVWQVMTLLGWIGITRPILRRYRRVVHSAQAPAPASVLDASSPRGLRIAQLAAHLVIILTLAALHVAILLALSAILFIPITANVAGLWRAAFGVYLPLDALVYLAIHALGAASDVERMRHEALQRESALRASALDSRLDAIRARLNPHFLFNALNSVRTLASAGKTDDTTRVLDGLSALLRYVLDDRRTSVALSDELAFVDRYLALQQVRYGTRLTYEIVNDASLDACVPQLILQPIVENAVEHGIESSLDGGAIRVSVSRHDETLLLSVEDDGPGPRPANSGSGFGLSSTRERLTTLFGERAALSIGVPSAGRGTRVELRLPFVSADANSPATVA